MVARRRSGILGAKDKRESVSPVLAAKHALANRLVFSKWREGVGGSIAVLCFGRRTSVEKTCPMRFGPPAFRSFRATA